MSLISSACYAGPGRVKKELLFDVRTEARRCAVLVVSNKDFNKILDFKSSCDTFVIDSRRMAHIFVDRQWLTATIVDSADSDGGDLDNLTISNSRGRVLATRTNIPSCGSIVVALAGETGLQREVVNE